MTVRANDEMMPSFTVISNEFIDAYMPSANGEYVKVYLYVLRAGGHVSCEEIADALEMTAADAARAVSYWDKRGLLSMCAETGKEEDADMTYEQASSVKPSYIQPIPVRSDAAPGAGDDAASGGLRTAADGAVGDTDVQAGSSSSRSANIRQSADTRQGADVQQSLPDRQAISADDIARLRDDEEFAGLLYCLQQYMGRTFGQKDVESLVYMYDTLHLSADMIEYLAEVCVKRGRTSSRYMEAIARGWAQKNITTVDEARAESSQYSSQVWTVMRAFGINDRNPAQVEQTYVDKWFHTYAFSEDIVKEAISRTMEAIHKPSFQYADSILEKWYNAGIKRLDEIKPLDMEHEKRARAQTTDSAKPKVRTTSFSNFKQRDDDLNAAVLARLKDIL